jgi:hypothetical protein
VPTEMQGRRVPLPEGIDDPCFVVTNAGDYCGPDKGEYSNGIPCVWFLLPIARDLDTIIQEARSLHHVQSPPHIFIEEPDGSLTIRESIGAGPRGNYYWHGYLTEGRWELNKSKP